MKKKKLFAHRAGRQEMTKKMICAVIYVAIAGAFLFDMASGRNSFPAELVGGAAIAAVLGMASRFNGQTK